MSLELSDTFNSLKVCMKCGWPMAGPYEEQRHNKKCEYVQRGAAAVELARRLPIIPSTKFGYGIGQLVFNFDDSFNMQLSCEHRGQFSVRQIWLLANLGPDQAEALVKALAAWGKEWRF